MSRGYEYDRTAEPPAPVLPVRLSAPGSGESILLVAVVDTGADMTVVPAGLPRRLGLPLVGAAAVRGVAGARGCCPIYAAEVIVGGESEIIEVLGLGREGLLGRNLLKRWVVILDGPASRLRLRRGSR
ncbi:MAG: hypothetical protein HYY06_04310 [Deltaproteobacteria bacterium]|nr:hypothetical protein [Deltaproteobacteria bacterium]